MAVAGLTQHSEAPAAEPGEGLLRPTARPQTPGDLDHQGVAGRVAHRGSHRVEAGKAHDHDAHMTVVSCSRQRGGSAVHEQRHVGEASRLVVEGTACQLPLETAGLGHVVGDHQRRGASLPVEHVRGHLDLEQRPVGAAVAPGSRVLQRVLAFGHRLVQASTVLFGADLRDRHAEKLVPRVPVVGDRRLVDLHEAERLDVVDPHRQRVGHQQQPERPPGVRSEVRRGERSRLLASCVALPAHLGHHTPYGRCSPHDGLDPTSNCTGSIVLAVAMAAPGRWPVAVHPEPPLAPSWLSQRHLPPDDHQLAADGRFGRPHVASRRAISEPLTDHSPRRLLTAATPGDVGSPPPRRGWRTDRQTGTIRVRAGGFSVTGTLLSGHTTWGRAPRTCFLPRSDGTALHAKPSTAGNPSEARRSPVLLSPPR